MNNQPSFRDVEQLSALLDKTLPQADAARLQARLEKEPELNELYTQLRETRAMLRQLPQRRAPRNFTLKQKNARVRPPLPALFPGFRLASILTSLAFVFTLAINSLTVSNTAMMATGRGGGGAVDLAPETSMAQESAPMAAEATEAPVATQAPLEFAAATQAPVEDVPPAPTQETFVAAYATDTPSSDGYAANVAEPTMEAGISNKSFGPEAEAPPASIPEPPIPSIVPFGLLGLSLITGAIAALMYWKPGKK